MRILVFTDNNNGSKALCSRLEQFRFHMPQAGQYLRYIDAKDNLDDVTFYGVTELPSLVMIDCSGAPIWRFIGWNPSYEYEDAIFKQVRHAKDADQFPQKHRGNPKFEH